MTEQRPKPPAKDPLARLGRWREMRFFEEWWPEIETALDAEDGEILPPRAQIFTALERTPPDRVRVVILGQDPYPTPGNATGLAFSVPPGAPLPASLKNIYAEMLTDIGDAPPDGDLTHLADQGVLLLNTSLTLPAGAPQGHAHLGWHRLARNAVATVSERPTAFVLWGNPAKAYRSQIAGDDHLIVASAHPSPLSARRGFFGSRPFSQVNAWLRDRGEAPIDWAGRGLSPGAGGG